jgi:hypothetical protein
MQWVLALEIGVVAIATRISQLDSMLQIGTITNPSYDILNIQPRERSDK